MSERRCYRLDPTVEIHGTVVIGEANQIKKEYEALRADKLKAETSRDHYLTAIFVLATPIERAWVANGLLLALFLSEVVRCVFQLYYYRRGL